MYYSHAYYIYFQNELLSQNEASVVQEVVNAQGQLLLDRIMRVSFESFLIRIIEME